MLVAIGATLIAWLPATALRAQSQPAAAATAVAGADEASALRQQLDRLQAAGDTQALLQLCESGQPQRAFTDPIELAVWQAICRGRGYLLLRDWEKAERAFQIALGRAPTLPPNKRIAAREYLAEASYRIGEMFETRFRGYPLCLTELGDAARAPREAAARGELQRSAERAYREVLSSGRDVWSARALYRITAMSDFFYRAASGPPPGLRGAQVPPPLAGAALTSLPLTGAYLAPDHSSFRRSILLSYRKLTTRVRGLPGQDALAAEVAQALADFESYLPAVETNLAPPWAARSGDTSDIIEIQHRPVGFDVAHADGRRERWSNDEAVLQLRGLLKPLATGRWSPQAAVALGDLRDRAAQPLLLEAIAADGDPELQIAAVHALGLVGDGDAVAPLLATFVRAQSARPRELFRSPNDAVFGLEERVLRALSAIGRRDPRAIERLLDEPGLPTREAAFVLWAARSRELYGQYVRLRDEKDAATSAYGVAAIVDLDGSGAKWLLTDNDDSSPPLLRCVKEHLLVSFAP